MICLCGFLKLLIFILSVGWVSVSIICVFKVCDVWFFSVLVEFVCVSVWLGIVYDWFD